MLSTRFWVAQSFLRPSFEDVVEETKAISTGRRSTVASSAVKVKMHTIVTVADLSLGAW